MGWNLDWLLGPRDWCVIRETLPWGEVDAYPIPTSRVIESDDVVARDLRKKAARRVAALTRPSPHPEREGDTTTQEEGR